MKNIIFTITFLLSILSCVYAEPSHDLNGKAFEISYNTEQDYFEKINFLDDSTLEADTILGHCIGKYHLSFDGYLEITYKGIHGPDGSGGGGCHNASSYIDIAEAHLNLIKVNEETVIISRSIMYYNFPKVGKIRRMA